MADALELAAGVLDGVAGEAQVTVVHERSLTSRFSRSAPTQATDVDAHAVHVLCVVDGHTGGATAATLARDALAAAARRARAAAEAAARGGRGAYPGLPAPAPARPHDGYDPETAELDPRAAGAALAAAFAAAAQRDLEAYGMWTAGAVETAIAASTGLAAVDRVTDAYMKVICRDAAGRSGFAAAAGTAIAALDGGALARAAGAKVLAEEPAAVASGSYPVVLDHDAVGTILDMLAGMAFN